MAFCLHIGLKQKLNRYLPFWIMGLFILTGCLNSNAQACIDPLSISPSFPCPEPTYRPVCGCDGETYRHDCEAQRRNGVQSWTDGPCSGFEFDLIPTFVTDNDVLKFTFVQNTGLPAYLYVLDYFGKTMIQKTLPASDTFAAPIFLEITDIINYRPGPYIVLVFNAQGVYRYKKFVKT